MRTLNKRIREFHSDDDTDVLWPALAEEQGTVRRMPLASIVVAAQTPSLTRPNLGRSSDFDNPFQ